MTEFTGKETRWYCTDKGYAKHRPRDCSGIEGHRVCGPREAKAATTAKIHKALAEARERASASERAYRRGDDT